jgi:hypothetical protein
MTRDQDFSKSCSLHLQKDLTCPLSMWFERYVTFLAQRLWAQIKYLLHDVITLVLKCREREQFNPAVTYLPLCSELHIVFSSFLMKIEISEIISLQGGRMCLGWWFQSMVGWLPWFLGLWWGRASWGEYMVEHNCSSRGWEAKRERKGEGEPLSPSGACPPMTLLPSMRLCLLRLPPPSHSTTGWWTSL